MGDNAEVRTCRSAAFRVKRALEKEKETADTLKALGLPERANEFRNTARQARYVAEIAREYHMRLDGNIKALEDSILKHNTDSDSIDAEIEPLADFSLKCIRWITEIKSFAAYCITDAEKLIARETTNQPTEKMKFQAVNPASNPDYPAQSPPVAQGDSIVSEPNPLHHVSGGTSPNFGAAANSQVSHQIIPPSRADLWTENGGNCQLPLASKISGDNSLIDQMERLLFVPNVPIQQPKPRPALVFRVCYWLQKFEGDPGTFWDSFKNWKRRKKKEYCRKTVSVLDRIPR